MIKQELYLTNTIHRFKLRLNSSLSANESAFSLYGILIIPTLLGSGLMYNVFQLRDEYFTIPFILMVVSLANIYFFYRRMTLKNETITLIIQNDYIQLMNYEQIYFQEEMEQLKVEFLRCGRNLKPAIKLSGTSFQGIVIGLKNIDSNYPIEIENKLCQPDYQLVDKQQFHQLIELINDKIPEVAQTLLGKSS